MGWVPPASCAGAPGWPTHPLVWPTLRSLAAALPQRWTKSGTALGKVVAALLQFGSGLGLGPDADGLLNLGDTQPQVQGRAGRALWSACFQCGEET